MFTGKEIASILAITIVFAFIGSLLVSTQVFLYVALSAFIIILINILAKKIIANFYDAEIETRIWEMQRYGVKPAWKFKRSFPAGIFFPLIFTALSLGYVTWMASLVFDVKAKIHHAVKRHGLYSFTEMSEFHIGLIAAAGIFANLIFAVIGYLIGLPGEMKFVQLSILYCFFNMLPISDLDGNKIFFGNLVLWTFLATICLIGIAGLLIVQ